MTSRVLMSVALGAMLLTAAAPAAAQRQQAVSNPARERARVPYQAGIDALKSEKFDEAIKSFQQATELDPTFDMAYYMLGRTQMATRSYAAAAIALAKCRDIHRAEASRQSLNRQEVQQNRRERINEINGRMTDLEAAIRAPGATNVAQMRNELQMLGERKRQLEDADRELTPERAVPSYVSLALGSAYFRSGRLAEAEQAYLATVAADPKVGEAHNNLAVVYMETGRFDEAEKSVKAAEKAGMKVPQALKDEIQKRKNAKSE